MRVTMAQGALERVLYRGLPMIITRLPEPLLSDEVVTGGFSAVSTAVGPDGPRMSLARLGLKHLLGFCECKNRCCDLLFQVVILASLCSCSTLQWTPEALL